MDNLPNDADPQLSFVSPCGPLAAGAPEAMPDTEVTAAPGQSSALPLDWGF
ncbi:MAG: hypothetical protein ACYDDU_22625 [Dermatophilaceae bacterium]|jgi:hypothetical protein